MPVPTRPKEWLIIYNTLVAQSLTDATYYADQRGLAYNFIGFNFAVRTVDPANPGDPTGNISGGIYYSDYTGATSPQPGQPIVCQTAKYQGTTEALFNGMSAYTAIRSYLATHPTCKGILLSTGTPVVWFGEFWYLGQATNKQPFSARIASDYPITSVSWTTIPNGRIGLAQGRYGNSGTWESFWDWRNEMLTSTGANYLRTAVPNSLAAEAASNNLSKPHWSSSVVEYVGIYLPAVNAYNLSYIQGQGVSNINLGVDVAAPTGAAFYTGTVSPPVNLFAYNIGKGLNGEPDNSRPQPGLRGFSNNYAAMPGSWAYNWTSDPYYFGEDVLYHGGSAAIGAHGEPTVSGLLDPYTLFVNLMQYRLSIAEAITIANNPYYAQATYGTSAPIPNPGTRQSAPYISCMGDPLYAPYKNSATQASMAYYGVLPGGIKPTYTSN